MKELPFSPKDFIKDNIEVYNGIKQKLDSEDDWDLIDEIKKTPEAIRFLTKSGQESLLFEIEKESESLSFALDNGKYFDKVDPNFFADMAIEAGSAYYVGYNFDKIPSFKNIDLEKLIISFLNNKYGHSGLSLCMDGLQLVYEKVDETKKEKIEEILKKLLQ